MPGGGFEVSWGNFPFSRTHFIIADAEKRQRCYEQRKEVKSSQEENERIDED